MKSPWYPCRILKPGGVFATFGYVDFRASPTKDFDYEKVYELNRKVRCNLHQMFRLVVVPF